MPFLTEGECLQRQPTLAPLVDQLRTARAPRLAARIADDRWYRVEYVFHDPLLCGWMRCVYHYDDGTWCLTRLEPYGSLLWDRLYATASPTAPDSVQLVPFDDTHVSLPDTTVDRTESSHTAV
jgi:hypothetical protein